MKKLLIILIAIVFVGGCAGQKQWDEYIKKYRADCEVISKHNNSYIMKCGENLHVILWDGFSVDAEITREQIIPLDKLCLVTK